MTSVKLLLRHERFSGESSQAIVTPPTLPQLALLHELLCFKSSTLNLKTKYNHQNRYIIYLVLHSLQLFISFFLGMCVGCVSGIYLYQSSNFVAHQIKFTMVINNNDNFNNKIDKLMA